MDGRGRASVDPMPNAAAIYCRISRDAQGNRLGVERQEKLCRELAERKGWTVAEVYVDNDLSATSGDPRPSYERMLADLAAGRRDGVLVLDQDRLVRLTRELEDFIEFADEHGIPLANVSGDFDLSTPDGRFRARIMGAVAQAEAEKMSVRLRRRFRQQAERGKAKPPGLRPFGYEADATTIRQDEAALIRDAIDRIIGGASYTSIAREWNERGIKTTAGNDWHPSALKRLLTNPRLAGLRMYRGELVGEGEWEPIITPERQARLRQALEGLPTAWSGERKTHVLTSIAECGRCGAPLQIGYNGQGYRSYQCRTRSAEPNACGRLTVTAEHAERVVAERLVREMSGPLAGLLRRASRRGADDDRARRIREELADLDARRSELARELAAGRLEARAYADATRALAEREEPLRAALEDLDAESTEADAAQELADLGGRFEELWSASDAAQRRALLHKLLRRVVILPGHPGRFQRGRVVLDWRHVPEDLAEYQCQRYMDPDLPEPDLSEYGEDADELRAVLDAIGM